jgi:predicted CXXCH cytochrome family protein
VRRETPAPGGDAAGPSGGRRITTKRPIMMNRNVRTDGRRRARWLRALAAGIAAAALLVVISCATVNRAVVVLPDIPGAKYVGSKECEQCHPKIYQDFATADHAKLVAPGANALGAGCESCHGPSSAHAESGGETKPPYSFSSGRAQPTGFSPQTPVTGSRSPQTVCFTCHVDVRGQFELPSHHPVPEGRMTCTVCHPPHKGSIYTGGRTAITSENEACLACHKEQRGPFVFEHEAMREGCSTCHETHGSVNAKMLKVRDANLCLKCHFQRMSGGQILIGGSDHTVRMQQGTCWTAGCHEAVHGSRVSSSLRF